MKEVILFLLTYLIVFIIYKFLVTRKIKKRTKKNQPTEVDFLVKKYNIDLKKVDYNKLILLISITTSLDITIVVTIIAAVKSFLLAIILGLLLPVPLILISYHVIGFYYKKKGMTK